ncbi:CRTAC1 family protein [Fulvivirgaceae bacterium BMA10]|uniref:CRTAC1 family protein n=1 Tax=Splendidivirga corallicola TaxID=3051826 RepID=A0ABT8KPL8_9BACT|nr:CRTAC1 family protein [Fulvivirgaceae bacterium BMA10]
MIKTLLSGLFLCLFATITFSQPRFTDVTEEAGINHAFRVFQGTFGGGVAVLDYDNDGLEDLFIAGGLGRDYLYKNNGDGTFSDLTEEARLSLKDTLITQGAVCADVNKDGYTDIFVTTIASLSGDREVPRASDILYLNNGDGTFLDASQAYGLEEIQTFSTGAVFGDINADGYPDLFVGNYFDRFDGNLGKINGGTITGEQRPSVDQFYINVGGKYFRNMAEVFGIQNEGFGFGAVLTDFDNDRDLDLYIINDFGNRATSNELYRNEFPKNAFTDVSKELAANFGINAMGTAIGDYNNDGWFDYFISNFRISPFMVGSGVDRPFLQQTVELGISFGTVETESGDIVVPISWGANFFDYDNDLDVDLFICNGALNPSVIPNPNIFLENKGEYFEDIGRIAGLADPGIGRGSVTFDYDNDGDLDLFVVNQKPEENAAQVGTTKSVLYRNDSPSGNWLKVKLSGVNADSHGVGSRIEVVVGDLKMIREIDGGSSHESQNSTVAHFGLADFTTVDSVIVKWIGGNTQVLTDIPVNQTLNIREEIADIQSPFSKGNVSVFPSYFRDELMIQYELAEFSSYSLEVFDQSGKRVASLIDKKDGYTGVYRWSAPPDLNAGVYYFVIESDLGKLMTRGVKLK